MLFKGVSYTAPPVGRWTCGKQKDGGDNVDLLTNFIATGDPNGKGLGT